MASVQLTDFQKSTAPLTEKQFWRPQDIGWYFKGRAIMDRVPDAYAAALRLPRNQSAEATG